MGKRSKRSDGLVFSTGPSPIDFSEPAEEKQPSGPKKAVIRIERKGRGGKTVTIIELRNYPEDEAKTLAKKLKAKCGVGGTFKNNVVELQGDQRERIADLV